MRQDLVLTPQTHQNEFRLQTSSIKNFLTSHQTRQTRSSSLPLKIVSQKTNTFSDKLIRSWNGTINCSRLCLYSNLSVSDYCINLIGNDLPIVSFKSEQKKEDVKKNFFNLSSDESNSDSSENISTPVCTETESVSETETVSECETDNDADVLFKLDEDPKLETVLNETNQNDLTITIDSKETTDVSSGYSSSSESMLKIKTDDLDETCRNLDDVVSCDDDLFKDFMPKKSCLKKLFIDTTDLDLANATSSPLNPSTPTSPSFSLSSSSSINSTSINSPNTTSGNLPKKRVSFADNNGKELFTVRTMSEPSNCPPKLTSKIVEYFLNREFNGSNSHLNRINDYYSNYRNYDYGISALNYTNDMSSLTGSIAVYSLNFAQPAGDYLNFRKRLDENKICLENVLLNRFSINGTIKVKNINFHKQVFLRVSFNNWQSFEDCHAQFVPSEYYSTPMGGSPTYSAGFYGNNPNYTPHHRDYDTFRFQFDLPKTVEIKNTSNNSPHNTIQFCVCYRTGTDEYWDNNYNLNYEILQYVIDIENLKPNKQSQHKFHLGKQQQQQSFFRYDSASLSKASYLLQNQSSTVYY